MCSIWWDLIIEIVPVELYAELSECDEESVYFEIFSERTHQPIFVPPISTLLSEFLICISVKSAEEYSRILTCDCTQLGVPIAKHVISPDKPICLICR